MDKRDTIFLWILTNTRHESFADITCQSIFGNIVFRFPLRIRG